MKRLRTAFAAMLLAASGLEAQDEATVGEGDTPLGLILQLMKRNEYTFPADIELEYQVPEDSDSVAEVKKCVEFC